MKHIKQYLNFIKEEYEWEPGKPQFTPKKKKYPNEHKLDLTDTSLDPRDTEGNFGKRWEEKVKITPSGNKHFYMSGLKYNTKNVHRIEYANGYEWYKNGELHRDGDKPAVEYSNGDKMWYQNGKLHRDGDKPAVEYAIGDKKWYKNDV